MVGHLGDGEVEPSGEVTVPRARGVVRRQEVVALEDPESNLPGGAEGLAPELFNSVGEEGTHPLAVEPGVRVPRLRRPELSFGPGEVEREMGRPTAALETALVPPRSGREVIQAGPQIGAETGPARIVPREDLAIEQSREELLDQILSVARLQPPLEAESAVGRTPVEPDQGIDRRAPLGGAGGA